SQGCTVNYPFGYGLSYSTFTVKTDSVKLSKASAASLGQVVVKATVQNTGTVAGKDVVEVYYSAPGADQPYQELGGYAKTDTLQSGDTQQLTIKFDVTSMAWYNEAKAAYQLNQGSYLIRVGDSSRSTHLAASIAVPSDLVTEQLSNQLTDEVPDTVMTDEAANFYVNPNDATDTPTALTLKPASFAAPNDASKYDQTVPLTPAAAGTNLGPNQVAATDYYSVEAPDVNLTSGRNTINYVPASGTYQTAQKLATTTAYITNANAANWENTGAPYQPKLGENVQNIDVPAGCDSLYDVYGGTCTMQQFVATLPVADLAQLVEGTSQDNSGDTLIATGTAGYTTAALKDLGIPQMSLSDGPAGLRITQQNKVGDDTYYQFATAWPIGTLLAQTWDRDLVKKVYEGQGKEQAHFGATLWLAPGVNLHRDPLNGRNFEYYSEDPLVAGETAAMAVEGVQETPGVGVTMKHFFGNNEENNRMQANAIMTERAARELYLRVFEIAVKAGQPMAIMSSYNRVNGTNTEGEYDLLTDILRGEWNFKGLVMTDWGGVDGGLTEGMYAGNDLIEPGGSASSVVNATKVTAPTFDIDGLPTFAKNKTYQAAWTYGSYHGDASWRTSYSLDLGQATLRATGAETHTTTVTDASVAGKTPVSTYNQTDEINNVTTTAEPAAGFASANDAYTYVEGLLSQQTTTTPADPDATPPTIASTVSAPFSSTQKGAITVDNVKYAADGTTVTSFDVTVKYDMPATSSYTMRLGDLQTNAARILNVIMGSRAFQDLSAAQAAGTASVKNAEAVAVTVPSWTATYQSIESNPLADTVKGAVKAGTIPTPTPATAADAATAQLQQLADFADVSPLKASDYKPGSWNLYQSALAAAKAVLARVGAATNPASADEVADALAGLQSAEAGLVAEPAQSKAALNAFITAVSGLKEANYTADSWKAFASALTAAQTAVDDPLATDDSLQAALSALISAETQLAAPPAVVDTLAPLKAALSDLVTALDGKVAEADYTADSYTAFTTALDAAKTVVANDSATQADVATALANLIAAQAGLMPVQAPVDTVAPVKAALSDLVTALDGKVAEADYTADSYAAFASALAAAKTVVANDAATQADVATALANLIAADAALVVPTPEAPVVDTLAPVKAVLSALVAGVPAAQGSYTDASWAALTSAVTAANAALAKTDATPDDIAAALAALVGAEAGLQVATPAEVASSAQKTMLGELIAPTADLVEADYTADSWAACAQALKAAEKVLEDANATPDDVTNAALALIAAENGLVKVPATTPTPTPTPSAAPASLPVLKAMVAQVGALKSANYTPTSWSVFTVALDSANAVLNKAATEEQVAGALASLIASTGALQTAAPAVNQVSKLAST
ncbi:MAG: FIVAR domain-containing protein, partial [Bifidobacteriaceae bacterium]|nr:FIVAR domain-containing protein [Bifidobacteriaceae bacterium]